jgi:hypothetical protein
MTTEGKIARCEVWEDRPQVCRDYRKIDHYRPKEGTYAFIGNDRIGRCECGIGACCAIPREGGKPGGAPLPEEAGGYPCQCLVWRSTDEGKEKTSSALPIVANHPFDMASAMREACGADKD